MKAKSHYSALVAETVARGSLAFFTGLAIFMAGFVAWSGLGFINAMIGLFQRYIMKLKQSYSGLVDDRKYVDKFLIGFGIFMFGAAVKVAWPALQYQIHKII